MGRVRARRGAWTVREKPEITRRAFLVASGAGIAAGAMPHRTGVARSVAPSMRIRVGVIGCGQQGRKHLRTLRWLQEDEKSIEIAAASDVYDRALDEARALTGCRTYHHWRDLLAHPGLDAVIIAAPDHWHAAMGVAAVQAGKNVFCETPMALSVEEAMAFRDAVRASRKTVWFNVPEFFNPRWRAVQNFVRWGAAGPVRWIQCNCGNSRGAAASNADAADFMPELLDWEGFLGPAPAQPFSADRFLGWRKYWDYSHGVCASLLFNHLAVILHALGDVAPRLASSAGGVFAYGEQETPDAVL
ncbi:MAG TPA: Gfo/Idh/MocA family oxidoreductase, partial [Candidatus Hydrogenedentes bacterium]|nr:Gfo/Idh/MocA family oxidoreductase [Candidatus Hydrogenedentota bacterium]